MEKSATRAEQFVRQLMQHGLQTICDDTLESFNDEDLPEYYNEELFKRGQSFYHRNILAMFFSKMLGLIINLALPRSRKYLQMTKMSSEPMTAYRRYLSTVFHMCVWYDSDFRPGSALWKSTSIVKLKHSLASKKGCTAGLGRITQFDMAMAQYGFMGLALIKSEQVGIHNASDEDLSAFVHLWRVIGFRFGMEDKFNICREDLAETKEICRILLKTAFKPEIEKLDTDFLQMAKALVDGMWAMNPMLEINVFLAFIFRLLEIQDNNNKPNKKIELSLPRRFQLWVITFVLDKLKYDIFRVWNNANQYLGLWLMKHFPFLGYYSFGYARSHIEFPVK